MTHIDDWIDDASNNAYARSWFEAFRRPAWDKMKKPDPRLLFASYEGRRYRVTGCSRLGDVWLSADFNRDCGYEKRVDVDACSDWNASPTPPTTRLTKEATQPEGEGGSDG